ncbi:HNH endonuclease family protein, partial [uncultured Muribaculum sp.]
VYKMPIAYRHFIFERMNNGLSKEFIDIVGGMKDGTISIEHIMPQTLSTKWKAELGPKYENIHEKYLHTFANLTLSAYNQSYSNAPFKNKWEGMVDKDGNQIVGFKDSVYSLSADLKKCTQWTETEILERQEKLISRFKTIWPMLQTQFTPLEKPTDSVTFNDEDVELTGRYLAAFTYNGERRLVTSWKAMLLELCGMVYENHKTAVDYLCSKDSWFHTEEQKGRTSFAPGCYVFSDNSTQTKLTIINVLFKECSIPDEALIFDLQLIQNSTDDE